MSETRKHAILQANDLFKTKTMIANKFLKLSLSETHPPALCFEVRVSQCTMYRELILIIWGKKSKFPSLNIDQKILRYCKHDWSKYVLIFFLCGKGPLALV